MINWASLSILITTPGVMFTLFFILTGVDIGEVLANCITPKSLWKLEESGETAEYLNTIDPVTAIATCRQENGVPYCPEQKAGRYGFGQAFYADEQPTGINIPATPLFNWKLEDSFSISLWIKRDKTPPEGDEVFIGRDHPSDQNHLNWWIGLSTDGSVNVFFRDRWGNPQKHRTTHLGSDKILLDNRWHYIVFTRDGQRYRSHLYIDGVLEDKLVVEFRATDAFSDDTEPITIGWFNKDNTAGAYYKGMLDEIALYDEALPSWFIYDRYQADERYTDGRPDPCK